MNDTKTGTPTPVVSAEALRMTILKKEMERLEAQDKAREAEQKKHAAFADDFLHHHVTEEERAMVRRMVLNAVKDGKFEALVYSFPSELCTDSGRAIIHMRIPLQPGRKLVTMSRIVLAGITA